MLKVYSEIKKTKNNLIDLIDQIAQIDTSRDIDRKDFFAILSSLIPDKYDDDKIKNIKRKAYNNIKSISGQSSFQIDNWISSHQSFLKGVVNAIQNKIFIAYENNSDFDISKYDIVIFDADKTIWKGDKAFQMIPPFINISEETVQDSEGRTISLREGVKETMIKIRALGIDIGIVSHSEDYDRKTQEQPVFEILRLLGIRDLINDNIVVMADLPKSMFIPRGREVLFVDDELENLLNVFNNSKADVIDAEEIEFEKLEAESNKWYKGAKRDYIPVSERPKKPDDGKEYELDHKKPRWKGGKDTKENLQWVEKNKHKGKSSNEGSFEYGGKDRHEKLKGKGKSNYSQYQSDTAKKKIEKEKKELGDNGFSKLQSERAKKRWNKKK